MRAPPAAWRVTHHCLAIAHSESARCQCRLRAPCTVGRTNARQAWATSRPPVSARTWIWPGAAMMAVLLSSAGAHHYLARHVGMRRARVLVGARLVESTAEAFARQQQVRARCAILEHEAVWRAVVLGPGDALTGNDDNLGRHKSEIGDGDSR